MNARLSHVVGGAVFLVGAICLAVDPPDSKVNPQTNQIETTYSTNADSDYEIRVAKDGGQGQAQAVIVLTNNSIDDLDPRIDINSLGDSWVVWWRDDSTDSVIARKFTSSTMQWSGERVLSESSESSRKPEVVIDGSDVWVVFEFDNGSDTTVGVNAVVDEPDPIGTRTALGTTAYAGDLDTRIDHEAGHLWVSWLDGNTSVAWSEYDHGSGTWSPPAYEDCSSDSADDARDRIRDQVLAP